MSRLDQTFAALRSKQQPGLPGLVAFATAGDPDLPRSEEVLVALDAGGASVLEVGVPFSDPLADGAVIQRATSRALQNGTTLADSIELSRRVRARTRAPIVLFSYFNPILRLGLDRFAGAAADAGVDGVLVLDLPLEEAAPFRNTVVRSGIDMIFLIAPTTGCERIRRAAGLGGGFLYAVSRLGVTGTRHSLSEGGRALVERIRAESTLPVALGFGISHPDHVREVTRWCDAAVVGSSIVRVVEEHGHDAHLIDAVHDHVRWLLTGSGQRTAVS
jgi:tryptophan synthase alpha chain